ncbi:hypothetical protein O204_11685 [Pseudomonas simiae]|uniref:Uncharacterized protein n=1 Tax=Pseudomonas simiae TaxID=321846 RepID=U1SQI4_9PSED|nr:hypothetical protein O204_11685 [Pseudomonas simiae]
MMIAPVPLLKELLGNDFAPTQIFLTALAPFIRTPWNGPYKDTKKQRIIFLQNRNIGAVF